MALEKIALGKLLEAMYADGSRARTLVRSDMRVENRKELGGPRSSGGDFYVPFWADAKSHAAGSGDLRQKTLVRIAADKGRSRLYPELADGFLAWWEQKRRYRNEPVTVEPSAMIKPFEVAGLGWIKIENTLSIDVQGHGKRFIYPYMRQQPVLGDEAARLGLWVLQQAATTVSPDSLRIIDVCRGRSFSLIDTPLQGDEEALLRQKYGALFTLRAELMAKDTRKRTG